MASQARRRRRRRRVARRADAQHGAQTPRGHVWLAQPYMDSLFAKTPAGFVLVPAVPGTDISRAKSVLEVSKRAPRKAAPEPGTTREVRAGPFARLGPLWPTLKCEGAALTARAAGGRVRHPGGAAGRPGLAAGPRL